MRKNIPEETDVSVIRERAFSTKKLNAAHSFGMLPSAELQVYISQETAGIIYTARELETQISNISSMYH
jgi:hypothetical protein